MERGLPVRIDDRRLLVRIDDRGLLVRIDDRGLLVRIDDRGLLVRIMERGLPVRITRRGHLGRITRPRASSPQSLIGMERRKKIFIVTYLVAVFLPLTVLLGIGVFYWKVSVFNALILMLDAFGFLSVGMITQLKYGDKHPSATSKQIMLKFIWSPLLAAILGVVSLSLNMPTVITATLFFGVLIAAQIKYHFG
jgi:hypothetical protein